jgi:hypothetical protein
VTQYLSSPLLRILVVFGLAALWRSPALGADASVLSQRFIQIQSQSVEAMRSGVRRLERACQGPLDQLTPNPEQATRDDQRIKQTLGAQQNGAAAVVQLTRGSLSRYRRNSSLVCNNPLNRVLTLFDKNSACAQAEAQEQQVNMLLRSALQWSQLIRQREDLFATLVSLEHQRLCLTPGFTEKMLDAYDRNMGAAAQDPSGLFRQWLQQAEN